MSTKTAFPQLLTAKADLTTKRDGIKQEIERLRQQEATADSKPLEQAQDILTTLAKKPTRSGTTCGLKLRGLVADIVERVEL